MSAMTATSDRTPHVSAPMPLLPLASLAARRLRLTAHRPRELLVPLLMPLLLVLVIAPALTNALNAGTRYESLVAVGSIAIALPVNALFSGISVIVDREQGAQRELLAAPIPRLLLPLGNLLVALTLAGLQVCAVLVAALARGIHLDASVSGVAWFLAAACLVTCGTYGLAEILAARIPRQEEYVARIPALTIVPWFVAGSLFPITAMPGFLTWSSRLLPLTHALALTRYGLLGDASGLGDIWRLHSATAMAGLSLAVLTVFALALTSTAIRVFTRSAVG